MWVFVTFDFSMCFLHKFSWKLLETLREKVPDVPFHILLCGANAMGYTNYTNNAVCKFCKQTYKSGVEVLRVFNSINYIENLKLGIDAAGSRGGFVEGTLSYMWGVLDPNNGKYDIEFYINLVIYLANMGVHSLSVKYMELFLNLPAATILVSVLSK